jgi:hypothetical protein
MSWDLSSEEVICNKLESQQTTVFAFSKKIKELEAKNVELEKKISWSCKINSSLEVRLADAELIRDCNASQRDAAMRSLKIAVEALEFYGDKENWQAPEDQGFEHHDTLDNSLADMIHEDHDKKTGGKRARQALAAIKGEEI